MKKTLSLLLVLAMVLSSFGFAFAAEDEIVPAEFLNEKGILKGNASGDLMLEENLKRQDMIVMLSRLLDVEPEAKAFEGETSFTDITDPFYVPYIAWAEANELTNGKATGKFGFDEFVTVQQVAQFMLRALDYGEVAWDEVPAKAVELKLVEKDADLTVEAKRSVLAEITYKALETKMKDSDKTLAEFLGIEMPEEPKATELTAKVLDTENLAEVVVELSNADLVENKEALTNPANYRLSNGVKVQHVDLDGDNVILTLVPYGEVESLETPDVLVKGRTFNLTIRNIDNDINKTYRGILANDNAIPVVEDVEFIGTHGIKVTTSEPIANPLERNFRLDSRTSMIVEQYGREIILTPYHGKAFDEEAVELTIDILEDFAGYKSVKEDYEMEISDDDALPVVEEAYRSGSKLVVVFDRDVYHDSIASYSNRRSLGNVSFVERRATFYADDAKKVDTNVVEYTFERDIPKGVEIDIEGVANHFDKAMEKTSIVPVEYDDEYAPVIISSTENVKITKTDEDRIAGLIDELETTKEKEALLDKNNNRRVKTQEMTITFDKDIAEFVVGKDEKKADVIAEIQEDVYDYFTLYELDVTRRGEVSKDEVQIKVSDIEDDKIKLTFENINLNNRNRDYDYVLEVRNFSDLNRNRMDRDYLDFQVIRISDAFNVVLEDIKPNTYFNRKGVEIVLEFNDYVDKEKASDADNYYLDGALVVDEAIVERDGVTVSLVIYDIKTEADLLKKYEVLEISPRVTNLDGDVPEYRFFELATGDAIDEPEAKPVVSAITYIDAAAKAIEDDVINVDINDTIPVNKVKVEGQKDKVLEVKVYKDGKLDSTITEDIDEDPFTSTTIALDNTASAEYEIVAKVLDGKDIVEEKVLVVNVLDTDLTVSVVYDSAIQNLAVTGDTTLVFPYGFDISTLTVEDFEIEATDTATITKTEKVRDDIYVYVEAENGDEAVHRITLDVATVTGLEVEKQPTTTTYNEGDTLELAGLEVKISYSDGTDEVVALADFDDHGITTDPEDGATLTDADTTVTITHADGQTTTVTLTIN